MQGTTWSFKIMWFKDVKSSHIQHDIAHFRHIVMNLNKKYPLINKEDQSWLGVSVSFVWFLIKKLLSWVTGDQLVHKGLIKWSFSCLETIIDPLVICAWENVWRWKCFNASIKLFCNEFMIMKHVSLFHFIKCIHIHW